MVNVALIIVTIIVFVLIVAANIYILVYFQHEEDKNTAYFPKAVVVISLTLAMVTILMLPMDVANSRTNGGFPMQILWTIVLITDAVFALGVVPFTIFFYEAEDPEHGRSYQVKEAVKWELITLVIFIVLTVLLWIFIGQAEVPVTRLTGELFDANDETFATCASCTRVASCNVCSSILTFRVSFPLYLISMLTFVGMFLFVFFGGIGMAALPMDLINGFRKRPKLVKKEVFEAEKAKIATRSKLLIDKANELKSKFGKSGRPTTRRQRTAYLQFRAQVYILEEDWEVLQIAYGKGFGPRLWQLISGWALLPLGILSAATSILWVLHLILFVVIFPPPTAFLNSMFIALDNFFGLFGTIAYGIFSFYLLWCVIKGNFKFGLRIPLIMTIHPMKVGGTMMNSFLFNSLLILLASPVVVQFCSKAFSLYNRFTGIDVLFNIAVQYLRYVKYVWFFYYWPFMILGVLTLIYLLVFPQDRKRGNKDYTIGLP